ncbi:prepilin-type N-terminal cleavage/methylation domain-containing protein [Chryseomicrobium aureum]|uniref:prepilin-type N-terminal cleavage/methylation domain-containing protein n=1 Tax=Chryseomicrobium aureum TaxID=1441723 RepID=UPI00370DB305
MNEQIYLEQQNESMGENSLMKKLLKKRLNQKGLTLIELLAVIVILAIIAAIAVPAIGNLIENSRYNAIKADAVNALNAANLYYTENPDAADGVLISTLETDGYLDSAGNLDTDGTVSKDSPRSLTVSVEADDWNGSSDFDFTNATLEDINGDTERGSNLPENHVIGTATTTPTTP